MESFANTGAPSDVFTSFYARESSMYSATPDKSAASESHFDFISFLGAAQMRDIDFFPMKWREDLDAVGLGGTAEIHQSVVDLNFSYAFKKTRQDKVLDEVAERNAIRALISELLVLGHPKIKAHPNIITLEGICWDIIPETGKIWPVLVFQKSHIGDLGKFMESEVGKKLGIHERLKLCSDIATAITLMHSSCHVIHGDIKPENVLIFLDDNGGYVAKVGDFGYATIDITDSEEEQIRLPTSIPWNAPESEDWTKMFSFNQSKLTDVYSFGVLCLWLLLHDKSTEIATALGPVPEDKKRHRYFWVQKLKQDGRLRKFGRAQIRGCTALTADQKHSIISFFGKTLADDPEKRSLDLAGIMKPFAPHQEPNLPYGGFTLYQVWLPYLCVLPQHKDFKQQAMIDYNNAFKPFTLFEDTQAMHQGFDFQLAKCFPQLARADYRLWNYIVEAFNERASRLAEDSVGQAAAFQIAVCYELGFGVSRDASKAKHWLERSQKTAKELENEVEKVRANKHPLIYKNLENQIPTMDYVAEYQSYGKLKEALEAYDSLAESMNQLFGKDHPESLIVTHILAKILEGSGDHKRAHEILLESTTISENNLGWKHPTTLENMALLATTHAKEGRLLEAEELSIRVMTARQQNAQDGDPGITSYLASLHRDQGQLIKAEELQHKAIELSSKKYGADDDSTLEKMSDLVIIYMEQERWKMAEELIVQVIDSQKRKVGKLNDYYTCAHLKKFSTEYGKRERREDESKMKVQLGKMMIKAFGREYCEKMWAKAE